jgi:cephalosporin hydroxylase
MRVSDIPQPIFDALIGDLHSYEYRGVPCLKNAVDMAIVLRLLWDLKPRTIVEVGSYAGGAALWMLDQMRTFGVDCSVHSVDVTPPKWPDYAKGPLFYRGSGRDLAAAFSDEFMSSAPHPLLMIEDADHTFETTSAVLSFFDRWSKPGDFIVVEDGDARDGAPLAATREFLERRSGDFAVDRRYSEMFRGLTFYPDGYVRRVR